MIIKRLDDEDVNDKDSADANDDDDDYDNKYEIKDGDDHGGGDEYYADDKRVDYDDVDDNDDDQDDNDEVNDHDGESGGGDTWYGVLITPLKKYNTCNINEHNLRQSTNMYSHDFSSKQSFLRKKILYRQEMSKIIW